MKLEDVLALGFDVVGGQIDYRGKNYGRMLDPLRADLTPAGETLVSELRAKAVQALSSPEVMPPKAKKAAAKASEVTVDDLGLDV